MMFRSFVWLKSLVRNRAYPEGSIAEGYIVEECLTFCSRFLEGTTRFTNERSAAILSQHLTWLAENSTFAPLHISRWDNELFLQKHGQMITDVEVRFS